MTREPARTEFAEEGLFGEGVEEGAARSGGEVGVRGIGLPRESSRCCPPGDEGAGEEVSAPL